MYPMSSLAVIAPIIFFVLLAAFPLIGVFGGWKRAAYWGGGNFVFYCIGLIIWAAAGSSIVSKLESLVRNMISSLGDKGDITNLIKPLVGVLFFLIVVFLANIILVINYYAWAKKVMKIKQDKEKWANKPNMSQAQAQARTKYNIINKVCGGVGMTALMFPTLLVGTSVVCVATTSVNTRDGFTASFHDWLMSCSDGMGGFSYLPNGAGRDIDAMFSTLSLTSKKITYIDVSGETVEKTALEALTDTFSNGISGIVDATKETSKTPTEQVAGVEESMNKFAVSWNSIVDQAGSDVGAVFSSDNMAGLVKSVIGDDKSFEVTAGNYENFTKRFEQFVDIYDEPASGGFHTGKVEVTEEGQTTEVTVKLATMETVDVPSSAADALEDAIIDMIKFGDGVPEDKKSEIENNIAKFVLLIVNPK